VDLSRQHAPLREQLHEAALRVLDGGNYIGGTEVQSFEREMAAWLGVPDLCGVACATSGLYSALKCLGIGPGDEVITTCHTAIATAEAVTLTGARVVFGDIVPGTYTIDVRALEDRITPATRAIIPVHLYGHPAELDVILDIAARRKLLVIEDCAQAQGARYHGSRVGTLGDAGVFSFFPSKNLGGFGDGGAVVAKDPKIAKKIRMFSNHGRESKYLHEFEGINSRLDAIQAALLRVCLPHLDGWNRLRRQAAAWYDAGLDGVAGVERPRALPGTESVYHLYVVLVTNRDRLADFLKARGIGSGIHYPYPLHLLPAYARLKLAPGTFPVAEHACSHMLSLPLFPGITKDEVDAVCASVREFAATGSGDDPS
jgi:dTDP-4-amino-4,6-dideoxygalactose transaminase